MSLADWINRYIVEVRPAGPAGGAGGPAGAAGEGPAGAPAPRLVPTATRARDLIRDLTADEDPGGGAGAGGAPAGDADPEIAALLAQARGARAAATTQGRAPSGAPASSGPGASPPAGATPPSGGKDERRPAATAPAPSVATAAPAGAGAAAAPGPGQDDLGALDDGEDPPVPIAKIYAAAKLGPPAHGFSLERIAGMLADPRLAALDDASRAGAVAVLLEGAGVPVASVVEEAATRDAALDRFEAFLTGKADEAAREAAETDARVEAEIARFVASKREEQARARDRLVERRRQLARYLRVKRAEELRLFEVVRPFTSDVPVSVTGGLPGPAEAPGADAAPGPAADLAAPPAGPQPAADPTGVADTGTYRRPELDPPAPAPPDPFRDAARKLREDRERRGPG